MRDKLGIHHRLGLVDKRERSDMFAHESLAAEHRLYTTIHELFWQWASGGPELVT